MLNPQQCKVLARRADRIAQFLRFHAADLDSTDEAIIDQLQDMIEHWDPKPTLEDLFELTHESYRFYSTTSNPLIALHRFLLSCLETSRKNHGTNNLGLGMSTRSIGDNALELSSPEYGFSLLVSAPELPNFDVWQIIVSVND